MKLTDEQIEEIAGDLECGMKCYYNKKTHVIKSIPDFDDFSGADDDSWEDDMNEIEENWGDYIVFTKLESREAFEIMADFAEQVDDQRLQDKLFNALNRRKPFQHFKWHIDGSGPYRQQWFDFRKERFMEHVRRQAGRGEMKSEK